MLTSNSTAFRPSLRTEFQALKQFTQREDGSPNDQETLPNAVFIRSADRFENLVVHQDIAGDLAQGAFNKSTSLQLDGQKTIERNISYQESDSGEVSYVELVDTDANGSIDVKNVGVFHMNQDEAILLS